MRFKKKSFKAIRESVKDMLGLGNHKVAGNEVHLQSAAEWLLRAQAVGPDKGVSRMYSLVNGWGPSYPETTGYIIPTLIKYGKKVKDPRFLRHALEMADWEIEIQLDCGGVMAGTIDADPVVPTIFNTGQNLFGWMAAYRETDDKRYLKSAIKAASWMADTQDANGCWTKFHSPFANYQMNTYNVRSVWGICEVYEETQNSKLYDAIMNNVHWALSQQIGNGWFKNNCLAKKKQPLTHTIGYTVEGLLEIGLALEEPSYITAAQKTAEALIKVQLSDGSLPGRLDDNWQPAVNWVCLTGLAQIAICWWLLYNQTGKPYFKDAAIKANNYLKSRQDTKNINPGIRGGIKGSFPANGPYGKYEYLNWATKFFMDSLMKEDEYTV